MKYSTLLLEIIDENIGVLKLKNAKKYNCLSQFFFDEFEEIIEIVNNNTELRALIICGEDGIFSSGGNLKEMLVANQKNANAMVLRCQEAFRSLILLDIPVVAMIDGIAIGGGFELALHCDFRFATSNSIFRFPEINFGILPAAGGVSLFSRYFNSADCLSYLLTGENIPIEKLLTTGIIQKIFSEENIYENTINFTKLLIQKPKQSIAVIKKNYYRNLFSDLNTCLNFDALEFTSLLENFGKEKIKEFFNSKK